MLSWLGLAGAALGGAAAADEVPPDAAATVFAQWLDDRSDQTGNAVDPVPLSEDELRTLLSAAVRNAMLRSPAVGESEALWGAALSDVDQVKGWRWPQVEIGSQSQALTVDSGRGTSNSNSMDVALSLKVVTPLYDFGRTRGTLKSREQSALAAAEQYAAQQQNNAAQVTVYIVELSKQRLLAEVGQSYIHRLRSLVAMLAEIVKVDPGRASELTQAKARLLQAQTSLDMTLSRCRDAELALQKLLGDELPVLPLKRSWALQPVGLEQLLDQMPAHPLLLQAKAESQAAQWQTEAIRSSAWPQLDWVINKTMGRGETGTQQPWETRLALSWKVFQGGAQRAARAASAQRTAASKLREEQIRLDLEYELRSATQDAQTLYQRADAYRELVAESELIRKAFFEQWYHLGRRTLLDVLSAESDYYSNQVNEVSSRFDGYNAVLRGRSGAGGLLQWLHVKG
ncbi:transporter [Stenotrophomonas sp. SAU14A_NAIMI4_8]|nr:transporter [Stenotrophomonas sp. SAU14A_NAIMI4_8]